MKRFAEFASAIKNNHNLVQRGLDLVLSKEHLETLLSMRTNVRDRLARLVLLHGHDFLPAVDILANWSREYGRDQGHTKSEAES